MKMRFLLFTAVFLSLFISQISAMDGSGTPQPNHKRTHEQVVNPEEESIAKKARKETSNDINTEISSSAQNNLIQQKGRRQEEQKMDESDYQSNKIETVGNKCLNLTKIDGFLKAAYRGGFVNKIKISVPQFHGISSECIQSALSRADFNLFKEWEDLIKTLDNQAQKELFVTKKLPEAFLVLRNQLETRLRAAWKKAINGNLFFNDNKLLNELIVRVANAKHHLMVRSSGAMEDTATCANPGGNKTEVNIAPQQTEVANAIENVICSYISQQSLEQRLFLGDKTIFNKPITPCVVQEMVDSSGDVPRSGVAFSQDASTGLDVTIIQGSYGFTAVTQADAAFDTFYVSDDKYIYPIIKSKVTRNECSKASSKLEPVLNKQELVNKPCLTRNHILALNYSVKMLAEKFECPVDVEFVVANDNLFIVQTRPIVKTTKQSNPQYFDLEKIKDMPQCKMHSIVTNNGSMPIVTAPNEIIVANTIDEALAAYPGQQTTKIVIIQNDAPAISHPAIAFRCAGIPVMHCSETKEITGWINSGKALGFDTQQGMAVTAATQNILNATIQNGWACYPLPRMLSLCYETMMYSKAQIEAFEIILNKPRIDCSNNLIELLKAIKNESKDKASDTLNELVKRLNNKAKHVMAKDKGMAFDLFLLRHQLLACYEHIAKSLATPPQSMERLLAVHFLESLIFQQPLPHEVAHGHSFALVLSYIKDESKIKNDNEKLCSFGIQLTKAIEQFALNDEVKEEWKKAIAKSNEETCKKLVQIMIKLINFDLATLWINTEYSRINDKAEIQKCITTVETNMQQLKSLEQLLNKINTASPDSFDNLSLFNNAWESLQVLVIDSNRLVAQFFTLSNDKKTFTDNNDFIRLVAISVMKKLVDLFDRSIKGLTGSKKYSTTTDDKAVRFKHMLSIYKNMFEEWLKFVPNDSIDFFQSTQDGNPNNTTQYLELINNYWNDIIKKKCNLLISTSNFSVSAFEIGSGTNRDKKRIHGPQTYEDFFTTIHQCLLTLLGTLSKISGSEKVARPQIVESLEKLNKKYTDYEKSPYNAHKCNFLNNGKEIMNKQCKIVNIECNAKRLLIQYNKPLRNHSAQYMIEYNIAKKKVFFTWKCFGRESDRFAILASKFEFFCYLLNFSNTVTFFNKNECSCTTCINDISLIQVFDYILCAFGTGSALNSHLIPLKTIDKRNYYLECIAYPLLLLITNNKNQIQERLNSFLSSNTNINYLYIINDLLETYDCLKDKKNEQNKIMNEIKEKIKVFFDKLPNKFKDANYKIVKEMLSNDCQRIWTTI